MHYIHTYGQTNQSLESAIRCLKIKEMRRCREREKKKRGRMDGKKKGTIVKTEGKRNGYSGRREKVKEERGTKEKGGKAGRMEKEN